MRASEFLQSAFQLMLQPKHSLSLAAIISAILVMGQLIRLLWCRTVKKFLQIKTIVVVLTRGQLSEHYFSHPVLSGELVKCAQ